MLFRRHTPLQKTKLLRQLNRNVWFLLLKRQLQQKQKFLNKIVFVKCPRQKIKAVNKQTKIRNLFQRNIGLKLSQQKINSNNIQHKNKHKSPHKNCF